MNDKIDQSQFQMPIAQKTKGHSILLITLIIADLIVFCAVAFINGVAASSLDLSKQKV